MMDVETVLSSLKEPVFVVDREHVVLEVGGDLSGIGYRQDFLVGKTLESIVAPPFRRASLAAFDTAFRLGKTTLAKVEVLNALGETVPVEMRVSPVEDKGRLKFFVILYPQSLISYDLLNRVGVPLWITDRKGNLLFANDLGRGILPKLPKVLPEQGQRIRVGDVEFVARIHNVVDGFRRVKMVVLTGGCEEYNPYVRRFATAGILSSLVAHDVKNAIASLLLLTDLIEDETLKTKIHGSIMRVYRIHQRILNLARGKKEVGEVKLKELLDEVEEDLRSKIIRRNVSIVRNFPEDFAIKTDKNALYEILLNLISNAIDVSNPGGKVVVSAGVSHNVSVGRMEKYVSVKDFGPGIPPDKVDKIFNLFFTSKKEGSGLGLFIVKTLSESIGARVSVRSEPGKGAEFTVIFPSDEVEDPSEVSGTGSAGSD